MEDIRFGTQINFRICDVGYISVVRKKDFVVSYKNGKQTLSFVYVKKGKMKYTFSDRTLTATEGQVLFVPKNLPYEAVYLEDDTTMKMIIFDIVADTELPFLHTPVINDNYDFKNIFTSVTPDNMRNSVFLMAKAYELVYLMQLKSLSVPKKYLKISPAIDEITKKYYENKPVSCYADICGMGESNFRRLFKEYTGKSFIDYRNSIRILEAKKLIENGECTVQDAAYIVGFNNISFYYDTLKKSPIS